MCGFAGLLRFGGLRPDDPGRAIRAAETLIHRGPDSSGAFHDSQIALGFRRLKIVDLSPAGEQPMANEDGSLRVVFNGEIYNHRELRAELEQRGHRFRSHCDTEVLLHLFEDCGEQMLPRLRGMFAFAIWDAKASALFMARDPLGVKPLYFAEVDGAVAFASEPKALFELGVERAIDFVALDQALAYRYVPAPRSGFAAVEKLPPGHCAWARDGSLSYSRWFSWELSDSSEKNIPPEAVLERIGAATRRRIHADVPVGVWLSGGIDSGLVLSQMPAGSVAFSAGFAQAEYDERELAAATARHLSAKLNTIEFPADVLGQLPRIVWHVDEPFFDSSALPVYLLAQRTKAQLSVVLAGDGGDEAFAGYDRYVGMQLLKRYRKTPVILRAAALAWARWRHPVASRSGWDRMLRWLEKCRRLENRGCHPYIAAMELFSSSQRIDLYGEQMREAVEGCDAREILEQALLKARESRHAPAADKSAPGVLQSADIETYLPGDLLHKTDRMSMAHGVEVRSPFLDIDLLRWALSLRDSERLPGRVTKPLLRNAAARVLPPPVVQARKKGFGVPLDEAFRGAWRKPAENVFENSRCAKDKILRPRYWEGLWSEHQAGRAQHGERLYALLALETWLGVFFGPENPSSPPGAGMRFH